MSSDSLFVVPFSHQKTTDKPPKIEVVGENDGDVASSNLKNVNDLSGGKEDEMSLFEAMILAQKEAKDQEDQVKQKKNEKESKTLGTAFKKGFLNSNTKSSSNSKSSHSDNKTVTNSTVHDKSDSFKPQTHGDSSNIPTIRPTAKTSSSSSSSSTTTTTNASSLRLEEVQQAMKEESNPLLENLRQGTWVTDTLSNTFQSNSILRNGFSNPKCMAAMQLLQSNQANVAKERFKNDPEVTAFLEEFGKTMANHFESLASENSKANIDHQQKNETQTISQGFTKKSIVELHGNDAFTKEQSPSRTKISSSDGIGPLHARVLEQADKIKSSPEVAKVEEEKVKKVLDDQTLMTLLMDVNVQQLIQECSVDPVKYQQHMRDPDKRKIIQRLFEAGLVGVAK